jgi:hypothetical protein
MENKRRKLYADRQNLNPLSTKKIHHKGERLESCKGKKEKRKEQKLI